MRRLKRRSRAALGGTIGAAALTVWLATSLSSAAGAGHQADVHATHAYVLAELALYRTLAANAREGEIAAKELADQVAEECGGIAKAAPRPWNRALLIETIDAARLALLSPDLAAVRADVQTLSRLRWSSHELTALVHARASADAAVLTAPPNLCDDWRSWVASGYKVLAPATRRIVARLPAIQAEPAPRRRLEALLGRYEGPRERAEVRVLDRVRGRVQDTSARFIRALNELARALGLSSSNEAEGAPSAIELQAPPAVAAAGGKRLEEFELGRTVAAQAGCLACHRIGVNGNRGPGADLTHIGSKLTGTQIARALVRPKPPMPSFVHLPKAKFDALVEFLALLH